MSWFSQRGGAGGGFGGGGGGGGGFGGGPERFDPPPFERPAPPRISKPPENKWQLFVRAWRPVCGWIIALVLLRVLIVPMVQLARGEAVEPIDLTAFAALAAALFVSRTYERTHGGFM